MKMNWKENWSETREHMTDWWNHKGFVLGHWGSGLETGASLHGIAPVAPPADPVQRHTDVDWIVKNEEYRVSCNWQGADFMPITYPDYGTVSLATFLGVEPRFEEEYILYHPTDLSPENNRVLTLDKEGSSYKTIWNAAMGLRDIAQDRFSVAYPAFMPGLDVLAELRGTQDLLMDLILNPDWVKEKQSEINQCFFDCYEDYYNELKGEDGSSMNGWFMIWGPGKTSLAQCDFIAMISPEMFEEFEVPWLREHCDHLDNTLFHLDGPDALNKLDCLLEIESLDAIQWTPGPQRPQGGDPCWYDMYKKIKAAGKSVQAPWLKPEEAYPLLDTVGPEGMYIMVDFQTQDEVEQVLKQVEQFR
ncbi:MAG: hypothetical protein PQJ58_10505 [Spirochaetales bacterium]|nr:hypothetical protein [Spirochaetales bacterium]